MEDVVRAEMDYRKGQLTLPLCHKLSLKQDAPSSRRCSSGQQLQVLCNCHHPGCK